MEMAGRALDAVKHWVCAQSLSLLTVVALM
uniref:Uncharacterized protein n=1 Tax=Arundo donax TaxID=35708 RepID=A0A0A9DVW7_ARUDO